MIVCFAVVPAWIIYTIESVCAALLKAFYFILLSYNYNYWLFIGINI